jgi:hypothetical protein
MVQPWQAAGLPHSDSVDPGLDSIAVIDQILSRSLHWPGVNDHIV